MNEMEVKVTVTDDELLCIGSAIENYIEKQKENLQWWLEASMPLEQQERRKKEIEWHKKVLTLLIHSGEKFYTNKTTLENTRKYLESKEEKHTKTNISY